MYIYDLLIMLITVMCDMICKVSYLTRGDLIIFAEMVLQSHCTTIGVTRDQLKRAFYTRITPEFCTKLIHSSEEYINGLIH